LRKQTLAGKCGAEQPRNGTSRRPSSLGFRARNGRGGERATDLGLVEERSMVGEDPVALLEGRLRALLLVAAAGVGRAPHGGDESVPPALSVPSEERERER
jgi:hypothetical protein